MDPVSDELARKAKKADDANHAMEIYSRMDDLNKVSYYKWLLWKDEMELVFLLKYLHVAIDEDEPIKPTDTTLPKEKAKYEKWERSNSLCLALMEGKMSRSIFYSLAASNKSSNAKQMLAALEEMVMKHERTKAPRMLKKLLNMRYDGHDNVRLHLIKMANLARRLRSVPDYLINRLAIDSLPSRFDPIHAIYIVQGEKWGFDEIVSRCGDTEDFFLLKDEANHVVDKRGMPRNANEKSKDQQGHGAKKTRNVQCFSCGQKGHFARTCWQASSK